MPFCWEMTCFLHNKMKRADPKVSPNIFLFKSKAFTLLLQRLLNSDSHGDSHTDHGVVTSAQEAHHLHVKSACRRLCACGAGTF